MFKKIATRAVLAAVAVATIASFTAGDAKAWVIYHGGWGWHYYWTPRVYVGPGVTFGPAVSCVPGHYNYMGYWVPAHCV